MTKIDMWREIVISVLAALHGFQRSRIIYLKMLVQIRFSHLFHSMSVIDVCHLFHLTLMYTV